MASAGPLSALIFPILPLFSVLPNEMPVSELAVSFVWLGCALTPSQRFFVWPADCFAGILQVDACFLDSLFWAS